MSDEELDARRQWAEGDEFKREVMRAPRVIYKALLARDERITALLAEVERLRAFVREVAHGWPNEWADRDAWDIFIEALRKEARALLSMEDTP